MKEQTLINNTNANSKTIFIPPRKRQSVKKINGAVPQNYVDHITASQDLPNSILQQINNESENLNINEEDEYDEEERNELQTIGNTYQNRSNFTVTPSSQSESSLDRQSNKSREFYTNPPSSKKRVNYKNPTTPTYEGLESGDTSILNGDLEEEDNKSKYLTMTGTIKRGKKKGQSIDVQLNISREELEKINFLNLQAADKLTNKNKCCICSPTAGVHVFVFTLICLPFVIIYTGIYSFYIGTLTWYNMFTYFNEEKSCIYKIFMSPILILAYPIAIVLCTLGLGIYAGLKQVSCRFSNWMNEICDIEKGFYGWLCSFLHLSDCSPYEVVILMEFRPQEENTHPNSSTEELSL